MDEGVATVECRHKGARASGVYLIIGVTINHGHICVFSTRSGNASGGGLAGPSSGGQGPWGPTSITTPVEAAVPPVTPPAYEYGEA
jgi:hypothetical protein